MCNLTRSRRVHPTTRRSTCNTVWTTEKRKKTNGRRERKKPPSPSLKRHSRRCFRPTPFRSKCQTIPAEKYPCNLISQPPRRWAQHVICPSERSDERVPLFKS